MYFLHRCSESHTALEQSGLQPLRYSLPPLSKIRVRVLVPGFEPGSKAREAFMMGHYTIRATGHRLVTRIYSERVLFVTTFTKK